MALTTASLAACGGGGGDGGSPPPAANSFTVSGKMALAEVHAVDSDTNDPKQVNRASNDLPATAQPVANPVSLVGYLNVPGQGPSGPNQAAGDVFDGYKVRLEAGQLVELAFAADPSQIDVDLYVYSQSPFQTVGASTGQNRYECVQITNTGDYFVVAELFTNNNASSGGTVYQARISAPGAGTSCNNSTTSTSQIIPGQVVAKRASSPVISKASQAMATMATPVAIKGSLSNDRSALIGVPADMSRVLAATSVLGASATTGKSDESFRYGFSGRPDPVRDTIMYAKLLRTSGAYEYAHPNIRLQASAIVGNFPPNDRYYSRQRWHYESIELPAAMSAITALNPQPTTRPIVAVIDTGVVLGHPDLQNQLIGGYDFIADPSKGVDGNGIDNNADDVDLSQAASYHGTHVAGTVGAETYNGIAGAGTAPMAQIMPIRVLGKGGSGSFYDIEQGIRFASGLSNDSGTVPPRRADILNLSLGGIGNCIRQNFFDVVLAAGVIPVVATGNDSSDTQLKPIGTPANCPGAFAIGATDAQNGRSYFSNGGSEILTVAPGGDTRRSTTGTGLPDGVYSTVATSDGQTRTASFGPMQGTSMATPHAAGIMALMKFVAPNMTPAQARAAIVDGSIVDDRGQAGFDTQFGYGQLNSRKAVEVAKTLAGGATAPIAGQVESSPSSLSLGSTRTQVEFDLRSSGASNEKVTNVSVSGAAISVAAKTGAVDPATGLGTYIATVDRGQIAEGASVFSKITVTLDTPRSFEIGVSADRRATSSGQGDLGPMYLLVVDASNAESPVVAQVDVVQPSNGIYSYTATVSNTSKIYVVAGSDTDNDGFICGGGEACGAYPVLQGQAEVLEPTGNINDIDFTVTPFGGVNSSSFAGFSVGKNTINTRRGFARKSGGGS